MPQKNHNAPDQCIQKLDFSRIHAMQFWGQQEK